MARDVNDIVVLGFGSWSDVTALPTLGFGQGASQSLWMQCAQACRTVVRALALSGISNDSHYIRKQPWNRGVTHPAVFYFPATDTVLDATNASDDYGVGVAITLTQASNRSLTSNEDRLHLWRESVMQAFHNKRLSGVSQVYICKIEPRAIHLPAAFAQQYDATSFIVRAYARVTR